MFNEFGACLHGRFSPFHNSFGAAPLNGFNHSENVDTPCLLPNFSLPSSVAFLSEQPESILPFTNSIFACLSESALGPDLLRFCSRNGVPVPGGTTNFKSPVSSIQGGISTSKSPRYSSSSRASVHLM